MTPLLALASWGVALGLHPPQAARLDREPVDDVAEIAALGAGAILLPIPWSMATIDASTMRPTDETIADDALVAVIRAARRRGLDVALMPYLTIARGASTDWRGVIAPRDPATWWRSYRDFVRRYAALAGRENVATFVVGSELTSMQDDPTWREVVGDVRAVFGGRVAYVANHDALDDVAVFADVDVAGVSAYFPVAGGLDDEPAELARRWRDVARRLERFAARVKRPVVLFEVGYPSIDGAGLAPWDDTIGAPIDLEEQRRLYRAACDTILTSSHLAGAFFWNWFGPGGVYDRTYTPRNKPAEQELRRFFRRTARKSTTR